jgi:hypothetical protein
MRVVEASLSRGFRNWGDIEIENDEDEEDEKEGHKLLEDGFDSDFSIDGTTYRLPEKGIKLDFLEKIHMYRYSLISLISRERLRPRSLDMLSDQAATLPQATGIVYTSKINLTLDGSIADGRRSKADPSTGD